MDDLTKNQIREAVEEAFAAGVGDKRFIDVSRIPLICQSIVGINAKLESIETKLDTSIVSNDQFWPVKTIVYGLVGLILTGVTIAVLSLVVMQQ